MAQCIYYDITYNNWKRYNDMYDIQQEFIRIFKEKAPQGMNPVDLLTDIIPMKKEVAYRRLRGEKSFTLNEVARIATYLEISLDDILHYRVDNPYNTGFIKIDTSEPFYEYYRAILPIIDSLKIVKGSPDSTCYFATNKIPNIQLLKYPVLSKFRLFKYLYQCRKEIIPRKMSEIIIPDYVREAEVTFSNEIRKIKTCGVWTKDIFAPYVKDILYFSEIGLLSDEEIQLMKKEMNILLNELIQAATHGITESGTPFVAYLLNTFLDVDYTYIENDTFNINAINIFGINLYSFSEPDFCDGMKDWFDSLLKYAVLISESGVVDRINFFKQQQDLLNTIG